jgi:REP element-mobilizing transposase RayT
VFFSIDDRLQYLEWLREAAAAFGCRIHAYVLMSNHVHLLATPQRDDSLPRMMQSLGRRCVFADHPLRTSLPAASPSPPGVMRDL